MRPIAFHPASLVAGFLIGLTCLISMSQVAIPRGTRTEVFAHPRDFVQIRQGSPYVVPAGKILVITALGTQLAYPSARLVTLLIDGQQICQTGSSSVGIDAPLSLAELASGRTVQAGSTVSVVADMDNPNDTIFGRAWGYLSPSGAQTAVGDELARVPYLPRPQDSLEIQQGIPFIVPPGQLFVLTALGGSNDGFLDSQTWVHALKIDGQVEVSAAAACDNVVLPPLAHVPIGFAVGAGSTVEPVQIVGAASPSRAWGYLAPE
jgi:hypothetical protein